MWRRSLALVGVLARAKMRAVLSSHPCWGFLGVFGLRRCIVASAVRRAEAVRREQEMA